MINFYDCSANILQPLEMAIFILIFLMKCENFGKEFHWINQDQAEQKSIWPLLKAYLSFFSFFDTLAMNFSDCLANILHPLEMAILILISLMKCEVFDKDFLFMNQHPQNHSGLLAE